MKCYWFSILRPTVCYVMSPTQSHLSVEEVVRSKMKQNTVQAKARDVLTHEDVLLRLKINNRASAFRPTH